ncbi:MAG: hypothetical protein EBR85_07610 [Betaproteobacteria bacterium]|nr:hypothetical protein [Betaproteobacteria bacterium]
MQIIELKRLDREGRAVEKVPGVRITPSGLVFEKALNIEQWKEVGRWLQSCRRAQTWLDADWLNYGKKSYDEGDLQEALDQLEFNFGPKTDALFALGTVPIEKRRPELTASHYLELQKLKTAKDQDKWAKLAVAEKLTPNDLKRSIASGEVVRGSDERSSGVWTLQAWVTEFEIWKRDLPAGWQDDKSWHRMVRDWIKPVIEFVETVKAKE